MFVKAKYIFRNAELEENLLEGIKVAVREKWSHFRWIPNLDIGHDHLLLLGVSNEMRTSSNIFGGYPKILASSFTFYLQQ